MGSAFSQLMHSTFRLHIVPVQCAQACMKHVGTQKISTQSSKLKKKRKLKIKFWGFHGVVLVKTFPLMYQLLM